MLEETSVREFHGQWGSLAVSESKYSGFSPYEDSDCIFVIVGGPLLKFCNNEFLSGDNSSSEGTIRVFKRWRSGDLKPENDLSGPFAILVIDKNEKTSRVITDLMSFIRVWKTEESQGGCAHSTHVDVLAEFLKLNKSDLDFVGIAEFLFTGIVTYPYSFYKNLKQVAPATEIVCDTVGGVVSKTEYYSFNKIDLNSSVAEFGRELREHVQNYVVRVCETTEDLALFLSAGEDSRAVLSFLPAHKKRNAFIFLDDMNLEGRIAEKVAKIHDANFHLIKRDKLNYLNLIHAASRLVGSGGQYLHAHSLLNSKVAGLGTYGAVFGGFGSDRLLKGVHVKKWPSGRLSNLLPQIPKRSTQVHEISNPEVYEDILQKIAERRLEHFSVIKKFRDLSSAFEWQRIWPSSMSIGAPNVDCNRRLFRSYEPFLDNEVVKLAARVPTIKKLNRRVYHSAMKEQFAPTKFVRHGQGWYPYFSKWTNIPIVATRKIAKRLIPSGKSVHDGPWADWSYIQTSSLWREWVAKSSGSIELTNLVANIGSSKLLQSLSMEQKINSFQLVAWLDRLGK